jgi:hypothetical protein
MNARPEIALAALVYLMTQYSRTRCPLVARAICQHLDHVADHTRTDPVLRDVAAGARATWTHLCAQVIPPPTAPRNAPLH